MASNIFNNPFGSSASSSSADAIACLATLGSAQSIAVQTITLLNIDTASIDTDSILDAVNNKIIPTTAGYYHIAYNVTMPDTNATLVLAQLKKNTTTIADFRAGASTASNVAATCNIIVEMNGSTDYIQCAVWHNNSANASVDISAEKTYLAVHYIGAA